MKLVGATEHVLLFQIRRRERNALVQLLRAYPLIPPAHRTIGRNRDDSQAAEQQRLLDDALAEQCQANKRQLDAWLAAPARFQERPPGLLLALERSDAEWLLQVLNDIRVGSWLRLGSPDLEKLTPADVRPDTLPHWMALEMSGYLQMCILRAVEGA